MTFGDLITILRAERCLSQREVARLIGVSHVYYGEVERGKKRIARKHLPALASALGVPESVLLREHTNRQRYITAILDATRLACEEKTTDELSLVIGVQIVIGKEVKK